jgi:DNA repair ATPase RecN
MSKIKVNVSIRDVATVHGQVEMTREQYDAHCQQIDTLRGFDAEGYAEDLMQDLGLRMDDADFSDAEVDDFCEVTK